MLESYTSEWDRGSLRDGKEDTSSGTEGAEEIRGNGEGTNAGTTKGGSSGDNTLEFLVHGLLTVTGHDETLLLELLGNVAGAGARDLNPGFGEDGAGGEHEYDVERGVNGVHERIGEVQWGRHVVGETSDGIELRRSLLGLPNTDEADEHVLGETAVEHLRNQEDVGAEGRLEHDGHVAGIEEANGVGATGSTLAAGLDGNLDAEALEVDDRGEDDEGSEQVHDVRERLAVESLAESLPLVAPSEEEVEEGNDGTLELGSTASVDGGRREGLPDDALADVGGNEERDTRAETVALLEKLIEENDNKAGNNELENEQEADTGAEVAWVSVKASNDIDGSVSEREDNSED